mmetsp:Transcript_138594/g.240990  ORF Transcript_138594/g.240990 Transcript_138594/m.240990 type:complete len:239 (+) Transcript_138594:3493-4209(+)
MQGKQRLARRLPLHKYVPPAYVLIHGQLQLHVHDVPQVRGVLLHLSVHGSALLHDELAFGQFSRLHSGCPLADQDELGVVGPEHVLLVLQQPALVLLLGIHEAHQCSKAVTLNLPPVDLLLLNTERTHHQAALHRGEPPASFLLLLDNCHARADRVAAQLGPLLPLHVTKDVTPHILDLLEHRLVQRKAVWQQPAVPGPHLLENDVDPGAGLLQLVDLLDPAVPVGGPLLPVGHLRLH